MYVSIQYTTYVHTYQNVHVKCKVNINNRIMKLLLAASETARHYQGCTNLRFAIYI